MCAHVYVQDGVGGRGMGPQLQYQLKFALANINGSSATAVTLTWDIIYTKHGI